LNFHGERTSQAPAKAFRSELCNRARLQSGPKTLPNTSRALQAAEKLIRAVGRGFIPGIKPIKSTRASAPEVCFCQVSPKIGTFSAVCLAPAAFRAACTLFFDFSRVSHAVVLPNRNVSSFKCDCPDTRQTAPQEQQRPEITGTPLSSFEPFVSNGCLNRDRPAAPAARAFPLSAQPAICWGPAPAATERWAPPGPLTHCP